MPFDLKCPKCGKVGDGGWNQILFDESYYKCSCLHCWHPELLESEPEPNKSAEDIREKLKNSISYIDFIKDWINSGWLNRLTAEKKEIEEKLGDCIALVDELEKSEDKLRDAMERINNWAKAYPLALFPKPDLKRAAKILKDSGMTLDDIQADAMRHVLDGVKDIVEQALKGE
uniref:Restriction alleviation protein n=1 Tax=viral metagenome TaxID=1070528 RepID=A0A6M3JAN2_9ZZZZ